MNIFEFITISFKQIWYAFFEPIAISEEMNDLAYQLINTNWFNQCGKPIYELPSILPFKMCESKQQVQKQLGYKKTFRDFEPLYFLLSEVDNRIFHYMFKKRLYEMQYIDRLAKKIRKRYISSGLFDISALGKKLEKEFGTEIFEKNRMKRKSGQSYRILQCFEDIFIGTLIENYYCSIYPEIPRFYSNVMNIFISGHMITGWQGKFPNYNSHPWKLEALSADEGHLWVW